MLLSFTTLALLRVTSRADVAPIRVRGVLCHPRNLLVKLSSLDREEELRAAGVSIVRELPEIGYVVVQAPANRLLRARGLLAKIPSVQHVDLDRAAAAAYVPNDPMWNQQWHTRAIKGDLAWDISKGSNSVVVAVIDTGVDRTHPDIADNIWTNPGDATANGSDDDHNGYADDVHGWDFVNNDNDPSDDAGHGTACSGLVAAVQDNGIGVSGVAPHCQIMPIKAANSGGFFYDSATVPAYIYAANKGAKVFSMSFFSDQVSPAEEDALKYAVAKGVLPVAAAGNDSTVYSYYPGAYECVLSVAALNTDLTKAGFSDFGSWVDVACPGVSLATITNGGGYTTSFAGTSGACPQVAGVAALCFSVNPTATPEEVRDAIEDSATLQNQAPFGEFSNYGLVNAQLAVQRMLGAGVAAKPTVVRWVSPLPPGFRGTKPVATGRIYGRGFGPPASVSLLWNGSPVQILAQTRDYLDYKVPVGPGTLALSVNGTLVTTLTPPVHQGNVCPLAEASTQSATLTGGFAEALKQDNVYVTCTRRSDGTILLQGTFRQVPKLDRLSLTLARKYEGSTTGTESIQLYDWSSFSYPYGNFVTLGSNALPTSTRKDTYSVPNPSRFVDDNGTVYFRIITTGDVAAGGKLDLDDSFLEFGTLQARPVAGGA